MNKNKITPDQFNTIFGVTDSLDAPEALMSILYDKKKREDVFKECLDIDWNVDFDWFHEYFQSGNSDHKTLKQDFTPSSISTLITGIIGEASKTVYDPTAGSGGLIISKWNEDRHTMSPLDYRPSMFFYHAEELSDRALPFLLFNLLIRGMNCAVVHGDTLSRECVKGVYFVQNFEDDHMKFSDLNLMPFSEAVKSAFEIETWADEDKRDKPIMESMTMPQHLTETAETIMTGDFDNE